MSLIQRIKSVLGLNGSTRAEEDRPVAVTVEHEPDPIADATEPEVPDEDDAIDEVSTEDAEAASVEASEANETIEPEASTGTETVEPDETHAPETTEPVTAISGIGPSYSERLGDAGITTIAELAEADADELADATDLSATRIEKWIEAAHAHGSRD